MQIAISKEISPYFQVKFETFQLQFFGTPHRTPRIKKTPEMKYLEPDLIPEKISAHNSKN